jgi:DNA (cytosine-5)-methyltransferase 1
MRHGSLFSGIGGFDLAAEWCGWENVFHCEWNTFGQKVLKHHFPNSISYNDITKTDFTIHRGTIDIISGGFPCQPYSSAGKRLGKEDERHLWPEMLRAIREIQPSWVVGENVRGLTNWNGGLVFDEVQTELEAEGYEVLPFLLPACAVNAPHRRDRIWFVAFKDTNKNGRGSEQWKKETDKRKLRNTCSGNNELLRTNNEKVRTTTDTKNYAKNSNSLGQEWGLYQKQPKNAIGKQFSKSNSQYMQNTKWENFPTEYPLCNGNDGLSERLDRITFSKWRKESIKAGGNAVVPQVAYQIFKSICKYQEL